MEETERDGRSVLLNCRSWLSPRVSGTYDSRIVWRKAVCRMPPLR